MTWIRKPFIRYSRNTVHDPEPGGNGNGRFEPGESGEITVTLSNTGNQEASNVTATLRSGHELFRITDSTGNFGDIPAGATGSNNNDRFAAHAYASIPPGTNVPCTLQVRSDEWGEWLCAFVVPVGVEPVPGRFVATIDTGAVSLSVCGAGSLGYDEPNHAAGSGFQVPKGSASRLYFGSIMAGNAESYLVDHFYSQPANGATNKDWRMTDSLRFVLPLPADERWVGRMDDAGHPSPLGLNVEQNWYMNAAFGYRDWAIVTLDLENRGAGTISGLHAGVIGDFDVGTMSTADIAGSDTVRRAVWMRQAATDNPTVGFALLDPTRFANLTAVDHLRYVYPDSAMSDGMKWRHLNGTIVLRQSNRNDDWSILASAGPFDLAVGGTRRVTFAVVGATTQAGWFAAVDSAQRWYDNILGIEGPEPQLSGYKSNKLNWLAQTRISSCGRFSVSS